jgi:hypothetical protein
MATDKNIERTGAARTLDSGTDLNRAEYVL